MPEQKSPNYIAFDIGGANIKSACLYESDKKEIHISCKRNTFPIWQKIKQLKVFLHDFLVNKNLTHLKGIAVTITAELSDIFNTKREGIDYILKSLDEITPGQDIYVYTNRGEFISTSGARRRPFDVAAANWVAPASLVSRLLPEGIFIDIGSTTTDLIPFIDNRIQTFGHTDPERLVAGELVYTGVIRTPVNHLANMAPYKGSYCRLSPEYFSITADLHVILGNIKEESYNWPTPDKRGTDIGQAMSRLAKVVCADSEMLTKAEIKQMASYFYDKQIQQVTEALHQILSRFARPLPLVAVGEGIFLAEAAGKRLGLELFDLANLLSREQCDNFSVWSLLLMLAESKEGELQLDKYLKDPSENRG